MGELVGKHQIYLPENVVKGTLYCLIAFQILVAQDLRPPGTPSSLSSVPPPAPSNLSEYVKEKSALVLLGKALF